MTPLSWEEFERVDIRSGTIIQVEDFREARNPSYKIWVDFWTDLGIKKTSAQITKLYTKEQLVGKQILGVINFPPKQIGNFMSEFLLTGCKDDEKGIVIATLEQWVKNGSKLI